MQRRYDGQITVFAALVFGVVISLIIATIHSAAFSVGMLRADLVTQMGVINEFSQYFRPLNDEYQLFFLEKVDGMDKEIESDIERSLKDDTQLMKVQLSGVTVNNVELATDNGGIGFKENVVGYMKYGTISDIVKELLGLDDQKEKAEAVELLTDDIEEITKSVEQVDKAMYNLVMLVDGIASNGNGFDNKADFPVYKNTDFVKLCVSELTPEAMGIYDERVFTVIKGEAISLKEQYEKLLEASNPAKSKELSECLDKLSRSINACEGVSEAAQVYREKCMQVSKDANQLSNDVEEKHSIIGDDAYDGFREEADAFVNYDITAKQNRLFEVDGIDKKAKEKLSILRGLYEDLEQVKAGNTEYLQAFGELLSYYTLEDFYIDYSRISFDTDASMMDMLNGLYKQITEGVPGIVLDGVSISDKAVHLDSLACSKLNGGNRRLASNNTTILEKGMIIQYLSDYFQCMKDDQKDRVLDYELEFICNGEDNDYDNVRAVVKKMVNMRVGGNLLHIFATGAKRRQAYAMASTLLGASGSEAIVRLGQLLIINAWAYSESVMDIKRVVAGDKLKWFKSESDWKMSLERMLTFNYKLEARRDKAGTLGYREMLLLCLIIENPGDIYYNAMSSIEMRMAQLGFRKFRFENFVWKISGNAKFQIGDEIYTRKFKYSY